MEPSLPSWLSTAWRDSRATHVPFEGSHLAIGLTRAGEPPTCTPTIEGLHRLIRGTPDAKAMSTMESLADVALGSDGSSVWLVRGGASRIRLFVDRRVAGNVRLTDRIEPSDVPLRPDFLTFAMAHAVLSPFERRATSQTVFAGVECVPPASCCRVDARGRMEVSVLDHATDEFQSANRAEALEAVRASVDAAIERAVEAGFDGRPVAFEVSGGIDSAIVAARTLAILRNGRRAAPQHAITIRYPYHEFRNEARYAKAVADALGLPVVDVKGEDCLPFDGWATDGNNTGCGDEPGLQQVGRRQHLATLAADGHQPSLLFHGFGGDTIFGFGPVLQFVVKKPPARPDWMSSSAWNSFLNEWESVRAHFPDTASGHRRQFFSGANIDDCWADMYLAPRLRVVRAGAFTATRLLNAAARLWQLGPTDGMPQYKWILREAFRDDLPRLLYERTHKIAYDGLYVRGYRRHCDRLAALVDRGRKTLQSAGISATGVKAAIDRIAGGNLDNDLLLSMLLCSLEWIEVRGAVPPR